jgi:glucokinase
MHAIMFATTRITTTPITPVGASSRKTRSVMQKNTHQRSATEYRIGVDVGKTKIAAGIVDISAGQVVTRVTVPTDTTDDGHGIFAQLSDIIEQLIASTKQRVTFIGIATFGLVDRKHGTAIGGKAFSAYRDVPLRALFWQRFGVPVRVENDVTAAAIGEYYYGLGDNRRSMTLVTLGTSAGVASISNGRLLRGVGGRAGQIAHLPFGRRGSATVSELLGGAGLTARALSLYGITVNAHEAFALAAIGDERFKWLIDDWISGVGDLVAWIVCILDPTLIVLTGGMLESSEMLVGRIQSSACHALSAAWPTLASPEVRVVRSTLGVDGAIIGATLLPSWRS